MSDPVTLNISVRTGATYRGKIIASNPNTGALVDLTGSKTWVAIKEDYDDADSAALIMINTEDDAASFGLGNLTSGELTFVLSGTQTDLLTPGTTYNLFIKILQANGDLDYVVEGVVTVRKGGIDAAA